MASKEKTLDVENLAEKAFSENTRKSYDRAWDHWMEFYSMEMYKRDGEIDLDLAGCDPYTDDEDLACEFPVYLAEEKGLSLGSINLYIHGVVWHYTQAKKYCPLRSAKAKAVMKGLAREIGRPQKRAKALRENDIENMIRACPDSMKGARDAALIALGFACALRRAEIRDLLRSDIEIDHKDGVMSVLIRQSKTDKAGAGQRILVPRGDRIRPIELVQNWITRGEIKDGYLFRGITRGDKVRSGDKPIHSDEVSRILKKLAKEIGIDPEKVSGHSLRAGFITSAAAHGARLDKIMEVSRHVQPATVLKYIRDENKLKDHAGEGFL